MATNCGQVVTPTTDETPLPCDDFRSTRCTIHEAAISYLSLPENTPLDEVLNAYLTSLIDTRNRLSTLEAQPPKELTVITAITYELAIGDAENMISFNNAAAITLTVPVEVDLNFPIGTRIELFNLGVGVVTMVGPGVTFIENIGTTIPQGGSRTLVKVAADTWVIKY